MKWNDIREKIKNPVDSMKVSVEKAVPGKSSAPMVTEKQPHSKRAARFIAIAVLVLIAIIIIWVLQSKKVTNYGPATDAGLTREQAQDAQGFLIQAQPKPMTESDVKEVDEFFKSVELKNSGATVVPVKNSAN